MENNARNLAHVLLASLSNLMRAIGGVVAVATCNMRDASLNTPHHLMARSLHKKLKLATIESNRIE